MNHSEQATNPQSVMDAQKSAVWIRRSGITVKVTEGADPAEIDRITVLALGAADRLTSSASTAEDPTTVDRIAELLMTAGPLTGRAIADRLGLRADAVRKALARDSGKRFSMHAEVEGPATWTVREDVAMRYLDIFGEGDGS